VCLTSKSMTPARDPDRTDVHRVLAGDVEAFSGIVERWQRALVNLAYWDFLNVQVTIKGGQVLVDRRAAE